MGIEEIKAVLDRMRDLPPDQRSVMQTALMTGMATLIVRYVVVGVVVWALGRRTIQAILTVVRENKPAQPEGGK